MSPPVPSFAAQDQAEGDYGAELPPPPKRVVSCVAAEAPAVGAAAPRFPFIPGYDVLAEIGRGGMGVVYKAWQSGLKRFVALKMIQPAPVPALEVIRRLRAE